MNYLLDTNLLFSLYNEFDSNHKKAMTLLDMTSDLDTILINEISIFEFLIGQDYVNDALVFCKALSDKIISNNLELLPELNHIKKEKRKTLKANDCIILLSAVQSNAQLVTFDKKLNSAFAELTLRI